MKLANDVQLINGLIGGIILGIASSGLILIQDKITGISGIMEGT